MRANSLINRVTSFATWPSFRPVMLDASGAFVDGHPSSSAASVAPSAVPIFGRVTIRASVIRYLAMTFTDKECISCTENSPIGAGGPRLAALSTSHYVGTTRPG